MVRPNEEPKIKKVPYTDLDKNYEDVMRRIPNSSKSKQVLDFSADIQLEQGLPITIKWQKEILKKIK